MREAGVPEMCFQELTEKEHKRMSTSLYYPQSVYSSFLGSTAQLRPWPPPQNPAEFLGGFSTIFFL
jgi:hypothetical protein